MKFSLHYPLKLKKKNKEIIHPQENIKFFLASFQLRKIWVETQYE